MTYHISLDFFLNFNLDSFVLVYKNASTTYKFNWIFEVFNLYIANSFSVLTDSLLLIASNEHERWRERLKVQCTVYWTIYNTNFYELWENGLFMTYNSFVASKPPTFRDLRIFFLTKNFLLFFSTPQNQF